MSTSTNRPADALRADDRTDAVVGCQRLHAGAHG